MPLYDYQCRSCREEFEFFLRPTSADPTPVAVCPQCGGTDLERVISGFAVNSDGTQQTHLQQARKLGMREARDKRHADVEYGKKVEAEHDH